MIHPSYVDLMQVVNQGAREGEEPIISSRYSIVMATARRARQLVAGDDPLVGDAGGRKALSVAVEELNDNKIKILTDEEKAELEARREEEARAAKNRGREELSETTGGDAETVDLLDDTDEAVDDEADATDEDAGSDRVSAEAEDADAGTEALSEDADGESEED